MAKPKTAKSSETSQHVVKSPLHYNGDRYGIDEVVDLDADTAASLIDAGVVVAAPKDSTETK